MAACGGKYGNMTWRRVPIAELRPIVTTPAPHTIFTNNNRVIYFVDLFIEGRTFPHNYLADL